MDFARSTNLKTLIKNNLSYIHNLHFRLAQSTNIIPLSCRGWNLPFGFIIIEGAKLLHTYIDHIIKGNVHIYFLCDSSIFLKSALILFYCKLKSQKVFPSADYTAAAFGSILHII